MELLGSGLIAGARRLVYVRMGLPCLRWAPGPGAACAGRLEFFGRGAALRALRASWQTRRQS
jgi:hypothetical protein